MDEMSGSERGRPAATRRHLLAAVGAAAVATLSGCTGGDAGTADGGGSGDGTDRYDGWLADANGHDGEVADRTDADEVTITVGAGDGLAYAPAAVRVSPETTVTWEWTGQGGRHNVVDDAGGFESSYYAAEGRTFAREFTEPGVTKYYCTPHENLGMVGVVEIVDG